MQVLGFLTSDLILALQWDHIYSANYFLGLLGLLAASLAACSATRWGIGFPANTLCQDHMSTTHPTYRALRRQLPIVRVARRWQFKNTPARVWKQGSAALLTGASAQDLGQRLRGQGYQVRELNIVWTAGRVSFC